MGRQRVVITGFGVIAPNGLGNKAFWASLINGGSGVSSISRFDTQNFRSRIAGEVLNFDLTNYMVPRTNLCRIARHTQFVLAAASEALHDAGVKLGQGHLDDNDSMPIYIGVSSSAMDIIEVSLKRLEKLGPARVPAHGIESSVPQQTASLIAQEFGIGNETHVISSACVSGMDAIVMAASRIQDGDCDIAMAGGTDASLNRLPFSCMDKAGLASRQNQDPSTASRPFDQSADSGVISEGSAVLILENLESAEARGASAYCEITGWGVRADRHGVLMSGMASAIHFALANAGRSVSHVNMICAHGPGHPVIDRMEADVLCDVFGPGAGRIPVTSIKGSVGNPLAAAGPMQLAATAKAIRTGIIPYVHNLVNPVSDSIDFIRDAPRLQAIDCSLVNIHGLGGSNVSVILERIRQP